MTKKFSYHAHLRNYEGELFRNVYHDTKSKLTKQEAMDWAENQRRAYNFDTFNLHETVTTHTALAMNANKDDVGTAYNNSRSERAIVKAWRGSRLYKRREKYQYDFEHGQWWVTELGTGSQWSVADGAEGTFDFEQVSIGDE